jgi:cellobiose phosphorylase
LKSYRTKYGQFSADGTEYIIRTPRTPRPWVNVISNGDYGLVVSQTGGGYSWRTHAQLNRLTRWEQDLIRDDWGKYIYIRDERGTIWSAGWKPVCVEPSSYECRHGVGYTVITNTCNGIRSELLVFVPNEDPLEVWRVTLTNTGRKPRRLRLFSYLEWGLGQAPDWHREFHKSFIETSFDPAAGALLATKRLWEVPAERGHWNTEWKYVAFHGASPKPSGFDADKESFLGMYGSPGAPASVRKGTSGRRAGNWLDPIGSLRVDVALPPGESRTVVFTLGAADSADHARTLMDRYRSAAQVSRALEAVGERWAGLLGTVRVNTPDDATNIMVNTWLKYQAISGRLWARTAYYQTGGAFGFRDQLQDSQIFLPIDPSRTEAQIRLHARHQFKDGSVYHWWHPISEIGLQNKITDNLLWLPFVVRAFIDETGEDTILEAREPFVDDPSMVSLYEHCARAIERSLERFSPRGLPLIGGGDWNDGLSAVGLDWKGESVWLGHFLHGILRGFAVIADRRGDTGRQVQYNARADDLRAALNRVAWDGAWYFRGTKDTGEKIGSSENAEGKIYLNAQTWAILSGVADGERASQVMDMVERHLDGKAGALLLAPAYRTPDQHVGYLTRYAPGMRENGGVYTHAATWAVSAAASLKRSDTAWHFYSNINPVNRGMKPDEYVAEPYVTPGNIEGPDSPFYGRGGWTWYSGSSSWLFKVALEWILGVRATHDGLLVDPCIPRSWKEYSVRRTFRGAVYDIHVKNPNGVDGGVAEVKVDGVVQHPADGRPVNLLPVLSPATEHEIVIVLGGHA